MHAHILVYILFICILITLGKKYKDEEKPDWAKKDIRDFTDADMERLLDQWEVKELLFNINLCEKF